MGKDAACEHTLTRRLESIADPSPEEKSALVQWSMNVKEIGADQDVVSEGDKPSECCLILKGHACRSKMTPDGNRQIMSFHIQGEVPDFQSLYLKTVDHSLGGSGPTLFRSSRACLLTGSTRLHFRWPIGQSMDFGLPR